MRRPQRLLPVGVALLLVAGACSHGSGSGSAGGASTPCHGAKNSAKQLLACVGPSLAYVTTDTASGSGVLLPDGYVVTNAHVVDPFPAADLTFPDGTSRDDVPVLGIDALADIAVLGPIHRPKEIDATPIVPSTGSKVEKGDDVYLLGYPGEDDPHPDPTISRGLLSRTRQARAFHQTYLQTDASIGGGQSGGALVDSSGHVIGISGLSFADEFALALDGAQVEDAVQRIEAGHGDPYASLPDTKGATADHAYDLADELDGATLLIPPPDEDTTVQIMLGPADGVGLEVWDLADDGLLYNQVASDLGTATQDDDLHDDFDADATKPSAPGTYDLHLDEGEGAEVEVTSASATPAHVTVHTSVPSVEVPVSPRRSIELGKQVQSQFDFFEIADAYTLTLHAGEKVQVHASSPQGDMAVMVRAPGSPVADTKLYDDGGGGMYDSDAEGVYTAPVDGPYVFGVFAWDGVVTGYRFEVTRARR